MTKSKQIGLQLKALRKAANLTQKALASKLLVTESYISHIEHGRNISIEVLQSYCNAVGVDFRIQFTNITI